MNRPKTNTYHEHYSISDDDIILITIGPKPWYSVFTAQVDITILTTYDKSKYCSQALNECVSS